MKVGSGDDGHFDQRRFHRHELEEDNVRRRARQVSLAASLEVVPYVSVVPPMLDMYRGIYRGTPI